MVVGEWVAERGVEVAERDGWARVVVGGGPDVVAWAVSQPARSRALPAAPDM